MRKSDYTRHHDTNGAVTNQEPQPLRDEYLPRMIHRLLNDTKVVRSLSSKVIRTVRIFSRDDDEADLLRRALGHALLRNGTLKKELINIVRRSNGDLSITSKTARSRLGVAKEGVV